jgi:hypothetical protein
MTYNTSWWISKTVKTSDLADIVISFVLLQNMFSLLGKQYESDFLLLLPSVRNFVLCSAFFPLQ